MRSITLRQLRDTRKIKMWLRQGKAIELRERSRVLGRIVPEEPPATRTAAWPDFAEEARAILGERILPGSDLVTEERGRY